MAKICVDVDLADSPRAIDVPPRYPSALVLLRWRGRPLGQLELPVTDGRIEAIDLWLAAGSAVGDRLAAAAVETLLCPLPDIGGRCAAPPISCSVIVCTRNRARELRRCLDSICRSGTAAEIIVVDNAPLDDATARVAASYPVQYVVEHRPGLNWARSRGSSLGRCHAVTICRRCSGGGHRTRAPSRARDASSGSVRAVRRLWAGLRTALLLRKHAQAGGLCEGRGGSQYGHTP
jgi:Glycosyl transferase family 2